MFDCGEGTQRQMMRWGVSFALADIFFTHLHADHILGVIGLIRTMSLQGRTEALTLWGPRGSARVLKRAESLGFERSTFPIEMTELEPETPLERAGYQIIPFVVDQCPEFLKATLSGEAGLQELTVVLLPERLKPSTVIRDNIRLKTGSLSEPILNLSVLGLVSSGGTRP